MDPATARRGGRGTGDVTSAADTARPPVGILAAMLALAIGIGLAWAGQTYVLHVSGRYLEAMANVRAPIKSITLTLQRAALASGHTLPLYGSSELYCCGDPYRPTQLFASRPTGFDVFAIGRSGIGNLLFMQMFGALGRSLDGKKLVMLDSPPWFANTDAVNAASYAGNFSPAIADAFIFDSPISLSLREAAARRMLAYPETLAGRPLLRRGGREPRRPDAAAPRGLLRAAAARSHPGMDRTAAGRRADAALHARQEDPDAEPAVAVETPALARAGHPRHQDRGAAQLDQSLRLPQSHVPLPAESRRHHGRARALRLRRVQPRGPDLPGPDGVGGHGGSLGRMGGPPARGGGPSRAACPAVRLEHADARLLRQLHRRSRAACDRCSTSAGNASWSSSACRGCTFGMRTRISTS